MNIPRLRALSARLRTYNGPFDLGGWSYCACGLACTMPEFNFLGLRLGRAPEYDGSLGGRAVRSFFDISEYQVIDLFTTSGYQTTPSPVDVANKIDALIADAEQETIERVTELV